jgi:GNAT superfamily N-acetyltransferase
MTNKSERLEVISWSEFQKGISPLWNSDDPDTIPIFNNPYNIIQYPVEYWHEKIIYFPCKYLVDNTVVGYVSIYNLSDTHIRPRGIYILPEYQNKGLGHRMQIAAWDLFPKTFYRAFIWSREHNVERFMKHSNMCRVPGATNIWSNFSKLYMSMLCSDRGPKPTQDEIKNNINFINENKTKFSFGGSNNLNVEYSLEEWQQYFATHKGNYTDLQINLDFE